MNSPLAHRAAARYTHLFFALLSLSLIGCAQPARAASWHGLEPLKSRRADVERALGQPVETDAPGQTGPLHFKVAGGTVTVTFVTAKFVATKKLFPTYEGTVLQVVLQHDNAPDTPATLGLGGQSDFQRAERGPVATYSNLKTGLAYTFVQDRLRTTYYSPTAEQLARARKGN